MACKLTALIFLQAKPPYEITYHHATLPVATTNDKFWIFVSSFSFVDLNPAQLTNEESSSQTWHS